MYGLPAGFDESRLVGLNLEQVLFTANTIHFFFSESVSITVESSFEHRVANQIGESVRVSVPMCESRPMQLIGESIVFAQTSADGTLTLRFGSGHTLSCYDDTPMYEAYRINFGDDEIVVLMNSTIDLKHTLILNVR